MYIRCPCYNNIIHFLNVEQHTEHTGHTDWLTVFIGDHINLHNYLYIINIFSQDWLAAAEYFFISTSTAGIH